MNSTVPRPDSDVTQHRIVPKGRFDVDLRGMDLLLGRFCGRCGPENVRNDLSDSLPLDVVSESAEEKPHEVRLGCEGCDGLPVGGHESPHVVAQPPVEVVDDRPMGLWDPCRK